MRRFETPDFSLGDFWAGVGWHDSDGPGGHVYGLVENRLVARSGYAHVVLCYFLHILVLVVLLVNIKQVDPDQSIFRVREVQKVLLS